MKKLCMYAVLTATLVACNKNNADVQPEKTSTKQFIRVQEVANNGSITVSPVVIVTVKE